MLPLPNMAIDALTSATQPPLSLRTRHCGRCLPELPWRSLPEDQLGVCGSARSHVQTDSVLRATGRCGGWAVFVKTVLVVVAHGVRSGLALAARVTRGHATPLSGAAL